MAFIKFADDAAMYGATAIDNMFIIEYLPSAPDAFLKVYLYARMLCLHPQMGGMEEMKRALNMDDDSIMNAFTYWERAGLVRRVADNPPEYVFMSPKVTSEGDFDKAYYKYRDFHGALQELFPNKDSLLHPAQYALATDWVESMGFSQEAVIELVGSMVKSSRSKSPDPAGIFRRADKMAMQLSDAGVTDAEGVRRELSRDSNALKMAREVIKQLGMRRNPTRPEQEMAAKWLKEWGATMDDILQACADTVKTQNPSFGYLDSILKNRLAADADRETMRRVLANLGSHQVVTENHMQWFSQRRAEGFEAGAIEFASAQQANRLNKSISGVEKLLGMWKIRGLFTRKAAEEYVAHNRALYEEFAELMRPINVNRVFSEQEITNYGLWKQTLPADLIAHAASLCAGKDDPVRAMTNLIGRWQQAGITTVEAACSEREKAAPPEKVNPALDYEQRDYSKMDFDDDSFMEEARRYLDNQGGND